MKRRNLIGILIIAGAVIIAILLYNRSRMQASAQDEMLTAVPVTVAPVTRQHLTQDRSLVGTVAANNDVAIVAETQGKVTGVFAEVGQYRSAGTVLIQVDDELKKAALESAETNFEKARKDFDRFTSLVKDHAATDQQVEGARLAMKAAEAQFVTARREFNDTRIATPISGIVTARPADVGTYVQRGTVVANVVDISRLKVRLNVAEREVFRLKVGDKVEVTTDVYPGTMFAGAIHTVSAKGDEAHTYPVEIMLDNPRSHPLKAGMFAAVRFAELSGSDVLAIPREALLGSMKNPQVYVLSQGTAHVRDIVIGSEYGNLLEVLSGLQEQDSVVVGGQNNLKDNAAVKIVQ
ncbi:MAG TPA: efflux RND transporter periplasmic adaptor subunit [Bacteroidota bacterium]|nr:efflux RND transporter periplasmic adaptor subunit [Bacteroidota bacterium]